MAHLANVRTYLHEVLLINDNAVRDAIVANGIDSFASLDHMDDEEIERICNTARSPGGMIVQGGNAVPNRGVTLPYSIQKSLRMLRYYKYHMNRIQRPFRPGDATLGRLTELWSRFQEETKQEKNKEDEVDKPQKMYKAQEAKVTLDRIKAYLKSKKGDCGTPLVYVIRERSELPATDPGYGQPTLEKELIARTPHHGTSYRRDNAAVWRIIRTTVEPGPGWDWIKRYEADEDGRGAYFHMRNHFVGASYSSAIKRDANKKLQNTFYDGKSRNFTFEDYCTRMKGAYTDLFDHGTAKEDDDQVEEFIDGINDPRLDNACKTVLAHPDTLGANMDNAIAFIQRFVDPSQKEKTKPGNRTISEVNQGGGGRNGGRGKGKRKGGEKIFDPNKPHKNYTNREWHQLTEEQKTKVREVRAKVREANKRKVAEMAQQVAEHNANEDNNRRVQFADEQQPAAPPANANGAGDQMNRRRGAPAGNN
jgi:hypothetical protein